MSEAPRPGYWAILPAGIRYDDRIPANAKLLYAEISSLTGCEGYCYADNAYFAGLYRITERSVRRLLAVLEEMGYIRIEEERGDHNALETRRIFAGLNPLTDAPPPLDKIVRPLDKKVQGLNIKNINIPPISPKHTTTLQNLDEEIAAALLEEAGNNAALLEAWLDFAAFRKKKRTPIKTLHTVELLSRKLQTLSGGDPEAKIAILQQSEENSWTGLFALKTQARETRGGGSGVTGREERDTIQWI